MSRGRKTPPGDDVVDMLTDAELKRLGRLGRHITPRQARTLMDILGIEERPERRERVEGCMHLARVVPEVSEASVLENLRNWNFPSLVTRCDKGTIRRDAELGTRSFLGCREECDITGLACPFAHNDGYGTKARQPEGGCILPSYAARHPERSIPDEALEVIAGVVGCCGQAVQLKARYLAACWWNRETKP